METALEKKEFQGIMSVDQIDLLKKQIAKDATDDELKMFLYHVNRTKLDPFSRQIYFQKRNTKDGPKVIMMTSIDGARVIAQRTGQFGGSSDVLYNDGKTMYEMIKAGKKAPETATIAVYKIMNDIRVETIATASYFEYYPKGLNSMEVKMPFLMISKVVEMLALRKAFPMDLSGLYIEEEMMQTENTFNEYAEIDALDKKETKEILELAIKVNMENIIQTQINNKEINKTNFEIAKLKLSKMKKV